MTDIVLVNRSTVLSNTEIQAVIPALQAQISEEWVRHWPGRGATLHFASGTSPVQVGFWPLYIEDTTDVPGAGGYHDDDGGLVQGKIFAADAIAYHEAWTVDASHEILEMLGDPDTNTILPLLGTRYHTIQEVCDPVEADVCGYRKMSRWPHILLSDFLLPAYWSDGPGPYDLMGRLPGPAPHLMPGGYISIQLQNGQWTQLTARLENGRMSRRAQRSHRLARRLGLPLAA